MSSDSVLAGIVSTILTIGIAWGILRNKVDELVKRLDLLEEKQTDFVTHKHLDAVVTPLQRVAEEIQRDIKRLLVLLSNKHEEQDLRDRY